MSTETALCILAAGKGTRMRSDLPKVLHQVAGLSMLGHALRSGDGCAPSRVVIVTGHQSERVATAARALAPDATCVEQSPQLGTGHAVQMAAPALADFAGDVFILFGDTPLIRSETLEAMLAARQGGAEVVVLGFEAAVPGGYGRLILDDTGALDRIVEAKEASADELAVTLCNSGVMCVPGPTLFGLLDRVTNDNAKGEYYLTDIVGLARADGLSCAVVRCDEAETLGVNSRVDLAAAEAAWQARARIEAMERGVTMTAPDTVFLSHDTEIGVDAVVEPHVVFGPGARVAGGATIRAFSHLEGCAVASGAIIGPYARLRPGADIGEDAKIGNFVEVKAATFGKGAKANHLTYVGDAEVGAGANIGAGTITCNYDGVLKHRTVIGAHAFIGSNSALVAPLTIGEGALVGAGSTLNVDVEPDALAMTRAPLIMRPAFVAKLRTKLLEIKARRVEGKG